MPALKRRNREGLFGSLLVIAIALLTLGLFVVAVLATPRADAAPRDRRTSYDTRGDGRDNFHWTGRLGRGQTLEVQGINGWIHAERATGNEVVVEAEKKSTKSDPSSVKIEVYETDDGVRICALYPRRNGEMNEDCDHQSTSNNDVQVNYTIRVPAGIGLTVKTVNGKVDVDDVRSDVDAATVNGSIELSTSGVASAHTVNGSIRARIGEGDWEGGLEFETVNGSIDLVMPSNVNAELRARSMNGTVDTDFEIATTGRISRRRLTGTIGDGGPSLTMATINGGIDVRMNGRGRRED